MTESRIYLDTNVFIYAIEKDSTVADPLRDLFGIFRAKRAIGVTSELTLAEVLAGARDGLRRIYLDLIVSSRIFSLQPVSREILIETSSYRNAAGRVKLPDAIHIVTAIRNDCRKILSADARLKLPDGYVVIPPSHDNVLRLIQELS